MTSEQEEPYRQTDQPAQRPALRRGAGTLFRRSTTTSNMVHAAFLRSPHPHANIVSIGVRAKALDGVVHVMTGRELSKICTPWQGGATHIPSLRVHDQHPGGQCRAGRE